MRSTSPNSCTPSDLPARLARASWIWPDSPNWDIHNSYALFRKTFALEQVPPRAPLLITADQSYQLFINGRFVCRGPARGFQAHWPYDEIDIRSHLKKGRNTLAVRAYNPGFSNFQYLTQGYAGLLIAARWGKTEIQSDPSWKSIRQASVSRDTVPTSLQLFSQEHIDLREESGDWTASDFDDSHWVSPTLTRWNSAPWFQLEPRQIPMLEEREVLPASLIGVNEGVSAKGYDGVRDVVALRYTEDRSHQATRTSFNPLAVTSTGKGKFRSYLFDFGKTVVGNLTFEIDGAHGGEIIDTYHTETVDLASLTPDLIIPTHCRMAFGDRLICRPGKFTHPFFHYYGFRYLCVTVRDVESDFKLQLRLNWVGYPLARKGSFQSSDTDLKSIWETCAWTQQCCSLDAYVDTPWREQTQWWGDARVQAWNTFHLAGDARLFRRGIAQIAAQTTPDGVTYGHAPTMAHSCILPDFTLIWMLTIWDYYWQTGSTEPLLAHHGTIQNALAYFRAHSDPRTGLVTHDERYWLFLDWNDLFKDGTPTVYNLWLLIALDKLALLYRRAKKPGEAIPLEKWAQKIRVALGPLIDKNGLLRDGVDRKGKIVPGTSIHSQTLALTAGLKGIDEEAVLDRILLPYIRGEVEPKSAPSAYWITYVFTVLIERGYGLEVIAFIKKFWLPMVEHGTTWEAFTPKRGNGSFSHAWSAHPLYHLMQTVGGIHQTGPAWSAITFHPIFHGKAGKSVIPSPRGPISSEWKMSRGQVHIKLQLPMGVNARVELPRAKTQDCPQEHELEHPSAQSNRSMKTTHFMTLRRTAQKTMGRLAKAAGFSLIFTLMTTIHSHAQKPSPTPMRIVCFGDSMTDGDTYPQIIMQAFHEAGKPVPACICSGVGGETAKLMDARFDQTVAVFKPDLVTVLEGTNDAGSNTPAESYEASIRSIVAKAKAIGARVMLLTPSECLARSGKTDAEKDASFAKTQAHLDAYEAVIRKVAADESCLLAENRKLFTQGLKDGKTLFVEDEIHPNYLGQSLIARSILDALGDQDVALPKTFNPKVVPGLVGKWMLRLSPLDTKHQPVVLDADSVSKLSPDAAWISCALPEQPPVADSPDMWLEQMRRNGAVMKTETLIGKGPMGQGVAKVVSAAGGPAFIQTGMGISTIWLNGVKIHDQMKVWRGAHPGKERIPINLLKGDNTIAIEFKDNFFLAVTPALIWEDQIY